MVNRIIRGFRRVTARRAKPDVKGDDLLRAIDRAPRYQAIPHQLFSDPHRQEYLIWRERFTSRIDQSRMERLELRGKRVLDLGCNVGYFGWTNSDVVESYVGIDNDPTAIAAARAIDDSLGFSNLTWVTGDVSDFLDDLSEDFDACLFFSVYHHLMNGIGEAAAGRVLMNISRHCQTMYFDMGQVDEPSNPSREKWHSLLPDVPPSQFIRQLVLDQTDFSVAEIVGETTVGDSKRLLFKFDR